MGGHYQPSHSITDTYGTRTFTGITSPVSDSFPSLPGDLNDAQRHKKNFGLKDYPKKRGGKSL